MTDAAGARLARRLVKKNAADDVAVRFVRDAKRKGWAIELDTARPSDVTFSHEGRLVLLLDEASSVLLKNKMLDERETDEGPRLRLRGC
jgi:hypothetical protein